MKLTFEPVTHRIGDYYYIVPKNDEDNVKCAMKCTELAAFIINLLVEDLKADAMIEATAAQYPNLTLEEVTQAVTDVRSILKSSASQTNQEEVV